MRAADRIRIMISKGREEDGTMNSILTYGMSFVVAALAVVIAEYNPPSWLRVDFRLSKEDPEGPAQLFHSYLLVLLKVVLACRLWQWFMSRPRKIDADSTDPSSTSTPSSSTSNNTPTTGETKLKLSPVLQHLQYQFLAVFWLFRVAFWMSGPYLYAAYSSKTINGQPVTPTRISQISLAGYAAIALLGPLGGKTRQQQPRGTSALGLVLYALGIWSVTSNSLWVLFLGRSLSGIGQSWITNSAEAWFLAKVKSKGQREGTEGFLGDTFGRAYAVDSFLAVIAGELAGWVAKNQGPIGPYQSAPVFLGLAFVVVGVFWSEARMTTTPSSSHSIAAPNNDTKKKSNATPLPPSIRDTLQMIISNPKLICLCISQACFESAMYLFVLVWAPTMKLTIVSCFGEEASTPYGTAFSCFMASCMVGSTVFAWVRRLSLGRVGVLVFGIASLSLLAACQLLPTDDSNEGTTTTSQSSTTLQVILLFSAYLLFEMCVGIYFPTMGTLRGSTLPASHHSVIMTLFAVPTNIIIVTVYLLFATLGNAGALQVATALLGVGTSAMVWLDTIHQNEARDKDRNEATNGNPDHQRRKMLRRTFQKAARKAMLARLAVQELKDLVKEEDAESIRDSIRESFASVNTVIS